MDLSIRTRWILALVFIPLAITLGRACHAAFWPYVSMFSGERDTHHNYRTPAEMGPASEQKALHATSNYNRINNTDVMLNDTNDTVKWRFKAGLEQGAIAAAIAEAGLLVGFGYFLMRNRKGD